MQAMGIRGPVHRVGLAHEGDAINCAPAAPCSIPTVLANHRMRSYDLWDRFEPGCAGRGGSRRDEARADPSRRQLLPAADPAALLVISATVRHGSAVGRHPVERVLYPLPPARAYRPRRTATTCSRCRAWRRSSASMPLRALAEPAAAGVRCVIAGEGAEMAALLALRRDLASTIASRSSAAFPTGRRSTTWRGAGRWRSCPGTRTTASPSRFMCARPVVTVSDSGGLAELCRDGESGFVTAPTPAARRRFWGDQATARGRSDRDRAAVASHDRPAPWTLLEGHREEDVMTGLRCRRQPWPRTGADDPS